MVKLMIAAALIFVALCLVLGSLAVSLYLRGDVPPHWTTHSFLSRIRRRR